MTRMLTSKLVKLCLALVITAGCLFTTGAPVQAAAQSLSAPYSQDFNSLPSAGSGAWTNDTTLPGWYASRAIILADDGTSGGGGMYSYGTTGSTERAFGALPKKNTGSTVFKGVLLQNDTGVTLDELFIAYTGEQWRNSGGGAQVVEFSYQVSPTVITDLVAGAWTNVAGLNFSAVVTGGIAGALNGNLPANQRRISASVPVSIPAGSYIILRWIDADDKGADHGLAVDDLLVSRNMPPQAAADSYSTEEDTPLTVPAPGVLANDTDLEGSPLAAALVTTAEHGTLAFNADGSFSYSPDANWNGTDGFTYTASDGRNNSAAAVVTLTVGAVNDAPIALLDVDSVAEDQTLTVAAPGVLGNDSDIDSDPLSAELVLGPDHGSLMLNADGGYTYTPAADWNGDDRFTYTAYDDTSYSNTATVTLTVQPVADAPVGAADSYAAVEDELLTVAAPDLLANDADADGDVLSVVWVSDPPHGTLTLNADGSFTYLPEANWNGDDSFTYQASDGGLDSAPVEVTLAVAPINDAPAAVEDAYTGSEDLAMTMLPAGGVLANDTDIDGDSLSAVLVSQPAHGTLSWYGYNGTFMYTPDANWNGIDSFTYAASDGTLTSNTVTVTLTVQPVNDAPAAAADAYSLDEDGVLAITAGGVLENDTDVDGDALTAVLDTAPLHGDLTLNADGSFNYAPQANWNGVDSFSYHAFDGQEASGVVAVTLTVSPLNDAPVLLAALPDQDTPARVLYSFAAAAHFDDIDAGDALTFAAESGDGSALPGWLSIDPASGVLSGTPDNSQVGSYTLKITASDGLASVSGEFTLTVEINLFRMFLPAVTR